jgi:sporulation protein YlmC with PRC-barrel domain
MRRLAIWTTAALAAALCVTPLAADEAKKNKPDQAAKEQSADAAKPSEKNKDSDGVKVVVAKTFRASDITNLDVRNAEGKDVGSISDLVVELNTGEVRYAALSFGGFAGFGDKLFAVPWQALKFKFGEDDHHIVVDVDVDKLENAQGFNEDKWPSKADPKWVVQAEKEADETKDEEAKEKSASADEKPATKEAGDRIVYDAVYRVSSLKGMEVRNKNGEDLGTINELVFDITEGKIAYAALSHGGVLGVGDKLFAVPFEAFTLKHKADEKHFVLNVSEEKLSTAEGFDESHWPDTANPEWAANVDRHFEVSRKPKNSDVKRE